MGIVLEKLKFLVVYVVTMKGTLAISQHNLEKEVRAFSKMEAYENARALADELKMVLEKADPTTTYSFTILLLEQK